MINNIDDDDDDDVDTRHMQPKTFLNLTEKQFNGIWGTWSPASRNSTQNELSSLPKFKRSFTHKKSPCDTSPAPLFLRFCDAIKKAFWQFLVVFVGAEIRRRSFSMSQLAQPFMIQQLFYHFNGITFSFGWANMLILCLLIALAKRQKAIWVALSVASLTTPKIKRRTPNHTRMFH